MFKSRISFLNNYSYPQEHKLGIIYEQTQRKIHQSKVNQKKLDSQLAIACVKNDLEQVKRCLKSGAKPYLIIKTKHSEDTLAVIAAKNGYTEVLKALVSHGARLHLSANNSKNALLIAVAYGQTDIVKYLLNELEMDLAKNKTLGLTALFIAVKNANIELIDYLISKDVNVNDKNLQGNTVLNLAVEIGCKDVINKLITHGAKLSYSDNTALPKLKL